MLCGRIWACCVKKRFRLNCKNCINEPVSHWEVVVTNCPSQVPASLPPLFLLILKVSQSWQYIHFVKHFVALADKMYYLDLHQLWFGIKYILYLHCTRLLLADPFLLLFHNLRRTHTEPPLFFVKLISGSSYQNFVWITSYKMNWSVNVWMKNNHFRVNI